MGRDMLVLQAWKDTGKPPLLGPQTSVLPFNQSAIYFYLLYPGFLLSQGNPISSIYTLAVIYIITFIVGLYLLKDNPKFYKILLVSFFLISIHPQYITQSRFVWNPSFVTPFIAASLISFYFLLQKFTKLKIWIFAFSIATAISLSYSVAPLLIAIFIYWLLFNRKYFMSFFMTLFVSFFILNLPTIFFEIRHNFFLTNLLFNKESPTQAGISISEKINSLSQFIFMLPSQNLNLIIFFITIALSIYLVAKNIKKPTSFQFITTNLYIILILLTLLTPVTVQSHYIFVFTSILFLIIGSLKNILCGLIVIIFSFIYLKPSLLATYFIKAPRSYQDMAQCFQKYCEIHHEPTFVSVESSYLPFHNGPEHRYLLHKSGCNVKSIETENGTAKYMTVVLDDGTFDSKTTFYELNLFGQYKDIETFKCLPNFEIKVLEKL